jgi:conjugative transfer pilus assembly protein TraH
MKPSVRLMRSPLMVGVALLLTLVPSLPSSADSLESQADSMFNSMANFTGPQAFKGQTMNTYTAGSMFFRVPNKTYQVFAAEAPYIRAGNSCGGIDAFAGSLSHISAAGFKDMLKGITSALPGVLFQLAIKSVEPLLGDTMEWFNSIATMVNRANISSCEAAKIGLYEANQKFGFTSAKTCETVATALGIASDAAEAREKCKTSSNVGSVLAQAEGSSDPDVKKLLPFRGNLVWQSLKKMRHLDDSDRELIMSITGTTVYPLTYVDGSKEAVPISAVHNLGTKALLYGEPGKCGAQQIERLSCGGDMTSCMNPVTVCSDFTPLSKRVADIMAGLAGKIRDGDQAPTTAEINFVNTVPVPVYRILAAGDTIKNSAISESLRAQFNDYVAVEFAFGLLSRMANESFGAELHNAALLPDQRTQLSLHIDKARLFITQLNADQQVAAQKAVAFTTIINQVAQLERDMRASMPQQVRDLLAYSALR